ncbi:MULTISPECIES: histidine phosphatase family protein [unclassified Arthrobacter]|uniref:histidine phosphatase family protein n=1 Tax=unclassified Arthrobacter TaxID=235627 RepID=UPI00159D0DDD|nr:MULTISPECIES: histidine phosphatase family protein [unclassified Arthrobacter]MCQ9165125.1 histidine phosphatase family protein [Arthrobacter sp. STN4]NVM99781.1 histidine phosphatase family protein [Arthrobacter sp. SDTb3-6]
MPRVTVHLLRHGEVFNPDGVLYGRLPEFHLSDRGRAMADMVAGHFKDLAERGAAPVHLVASPLDRAQETAQPTAAALGLDIVTDPRIIEAENHFEGMKVNKAELLKPRHWRYFANPLRPSWGEPYAAQAKRMLEAARDARRRAFELGGEGAQAIMVSHQLPIWATRRSAEGKRLWHDPRHRECTLASLTSLIFEGDDVVGVQYSEPAAVLLPGAATTPGA